MPVPQTEKHSDQNLIDEFELDQIEREFEFFDSPIQGLKGSKKNDLILPDKLNELFLFSQDSYIAKNYESGHNKP